MPTVDAAPLAEADAILAAAEELARSVLALNKGRGTVTALQRKRIGDRDGWICQVCRGPIDPQLQWEQPNRAAIPAYEAEIARLNPASEAEVLAWAGDDADRAQVAYAWSRGVSWKDRHDAPALAQSGRDRGPWPSSLYSALWRVTEQRALRNAKCGTVEHLIPVSVGGTNAESNLVIAHKRCNTHIGAKGSTNAVLLAAPASARRFLDDLELLRDAREIDAKYTVRNIRGLLAARRVLGIAAEGEDGLDGRTRQALKVYATHHRELWDARRACMERVRDFEFDESGTALALRREIDAIGRRLTRLKRPDAIERWEAKRASASSAAARLKREPTAMRDRVHELRTVSGHAHDAAWWLALRDGLPGTLLGEAGFAEPLPPESPVPSQRPYDPFNADHWAEVTDPDDPDYLAGTAMSRN